MNEERSFHHQRRPPDVEEALSSMLWTPYERTSNDSSSDEDDQRGRSTRLRKSHSSYEHRITYDALTSTHFGDDDQLGSNAAITTTSPNIANTLQSTPFVPFSNFFRNSDDERGSSRCDPISIHTNYKQAEKYRDGTYRYSYPYYGPIPNLNKWWPASISSIEPPSYESLYAKDSTASVASGTSKMGFKVEAITAYPNEKFDLRKCDNYEEERTQREPTFSIKGEGVLPPLDLTNLAGNVVHFNDTESHIELENRNNNAKVTTHDQNKEPKVMPTMELSDEMRTPNNRSQQTEKYNDKNNNNNSHTEDDDDDGSKEKKIRLKQNHQYMQLQCPTSSQSIAMARAIATAITVATDRGTKETEIAKTISHVREEVSQPVSCNGSIQNPSIFPHSYINVVNNQNSNNNNSDTSLNGTPLGDGCSNNGRRMNAEAMNTLTNLFAAAWSDKATSAERAHGSCWESDYTERYTAPPVVDAVAIIQSATCSFDGHIAARRSRSSLVALPSYSHLWKKALSGVRTKVKRSSRPISENPHVPITAPVDVLTPNKCLAELERLYVEFQASESALLAARSDASEGDRNGNCRQHCLSQSQSDRGDSGCGYDGELLNVNHSGTTKITDYANAMRLNIPAAATNTSLCSSPSALQTRQLNTFKVLPACSTSSIFLTSPDCATTGCLTGNGRAKGSSVSSGHRCNNMQPDSKNNNGDCSNDVGNQEIGNDDVVRAIRNDSKSNNAIVAMLASSAVRNQPSLTIHVNSDNSDQNNNNDVTNNQNNASYNNRIYDCNENVCIGVEVTPLNVNVGAQQKNIVKSNGVSVVNCNYSSVYTINNSAGKLSATTTITTTTTPVNSVSVSEVSPVPNILCTVKKSTSSNSVVNVSAAKNGSNGNEINNVNVTDSVNVISLNAQSQSMGMRAKHVSDSPASTVLTGSTMTIPSQIDDTYRSPIGMSVVASQQLRTFTSTECQTDEMLSAQLRTDRAPVSPVSHRAQRRRDRRERRQLLQQLSSSYPHPHQLHRPSLLRRQEDRHSMPPGQMPITSISALHLQSNAQHSTGSSSTNMSATMSMLLRPMIPDLLNRHFPPPYSALPLNGCATTSATTPPPPAIVGHVPPPGTTLLTPVISTVPMPGGAPPVVSDGCFTLPLPIIRRSPSERSGKGCCGQWFAGPPLRALIAVVALGGIACTLGGAALGATGLAGPPNSHLTASLLMIGVGVVLVTVSGAAWRMTAPGGPPCLGLGSAVDLGRCGRRPCGRGGGNAHGLLYPEFQHRPPPPSYQASMQEYRLRLLLLDRDRQNGVVRGNSPPPTYRSYAGSLLRMPLTTLRAVGATGSVAGTSEYSLPPSYRSRNTTTATISSERSIEAPPSDHLLPSEDIPDLSNTGELLNNQIDSTLRSLSTLTLGNTQQVNHPQPSQLRTSAIVEIEASNRRENQSCNTNIQKENCAEATKDANSHSHKELVTIVTISKSDSHADRDRARSVEHIEILAHL